MEEIRKRNWEEIGLLEYVSDERKDVIIQILDNALKFIIRVSITTTSVTRQSDGKTLGEKELNEVQSIFIPIVLRIAHEVDVTNDDFQAIYSIIEFGASDFVKKNMEHISSRVDLEAMYCQKIAEKFIESKKIN